MSEPLQADEMTFPPKTFGEGWASKNAADLAKIAIAFGGFDAAEIVLAVTKLQKDKGAKANMTTMESALQLVYEAHLTPEEKAARVEAQAAMKAALLGS